MDDRYVLFVEDMIGGGHRSRRILVIENRSKIVLVQETSPPPQTMIEDCRWVIRAIEKALDMFDISRIYFETNFGLAQMGRVLESKFNIEITPICLTPRTMRDSPLARIIRNALPD